MLMPRIPLLIHRRLVPAPHDDVEAIAERVLVQAERRLGRATSRSRAAASGTDMKIESISFSGSPGK